MSTKVIYHANCNDGFCAAWIAWLQFGNAAEYLPANYGEPPPPVSAEDELWILDFSYPRPVLLELRSACRSIMVLDHHKTAQAELEGLDFCRFDMERSGASLTRAWFGIDDQFRWITDYVEDRDLWRFKLPSSHEVNAAITSWPHDFCFWNEQALRGVEAAINDGTAIRRYIDQYTNEMCDHAITVVFEGHQVPCVNAPYKGISEICGKLAESAPFSIGWFRRGDGKYQYSLRSRSDFDVAELARRHGGGGHKNSAGFVYDEPIRF